ncbi:hypothetical protein CHU98_g8255 [Xylaria longipes]|nr:hypothetical protein CHU98_g8255 [Xylaria longipes]
MPSISSPNISHHLPQNTATGPATMALSPYYNAFGMPSNRDAVYQPRDLSSNLVDQNAEINHSPGEFLQERNPRRSDRSPRLAVSRAESTITKVEQLYEAGLDMGIIPEDPNLLSVTRTQGTGTRPDLPRSGPRPAP